MKLLSGDTTYTLNTFKNTSPYLSFKIIHEILCSSPNIRSDYANDISVLCETSRTCWLEDWLWICKFPNARVSFKTRICKCSYVSWRSVNMYRCTLRDKDLSRTWSTVKVSLTHFLSERSFQIFCWCEQINPCICSIRNLWGKQVEPQTAKSTSGGKASGDTSFFLAGHLRRAFCALRLLLNV